MTSSIRIAQVFPELVGKKTHTRWKVYGRMLNYVINYYDAYFYINDDAKMCRYLSHNLVKLLSYEVI